jgi:exopolysaccharide biosynthesis polyprenyl glycosylphosphotransferase
MQDATSTVAVSEGLAGSGAPPLQQRAKTRRRRPMAERGAPLLACLDAMAAVAAILAILISVSHPTVSQGLDGFLSARITVKNVLLLIFLASAWPVVFYLFGLYDAHRIRQVGSEAPRLVGAVTVGSGLAFVFPLTSVTGTIEVGDLRHFWVVGLAFSLLVRSGWRAVDRARHRQSRRALIVGTGRLARRVHRDLRADRQNRYEVVGFVDEPVNANASFERVSDQTIGTLDELEHILMRQVVDEVVIALPVKSRYQQIQRVIDICERAGVQAKYGADLFEGTVASGRYHAHGDRSFVAIHGAPDDYRLVVKRCIDVIGAIAGLILFAPLMLIVAIAIKLTSSGPVIYAQNRCGQNKRPLRMYKFRSMLQDADQRQADLEKLNEASGPVFKIRNDPRITPLGRFLRISSIDELPQLWNVLRGDMSLVGPRPLPWRDVSRITRPHDMRRFSMRPGITCLWQVEGRANLDFERWVELDLDYIDTWSLFLDFQILARTVPAVLSAKGAN